MATLLQLIPCELNCFDHSAYDFFEKEESDEYIISYRFKYYGKFEGATLYAYMKKGRYHDGGIALVVNHEMLYSLGEGCYITGYCPICIKTTDEYETN